MDAVERLLPGRQAVGMAEARPRRPDHQHLVAHAELARDDVDHRHVAAVGVDQDELLDAGAVDAVADVEPELRRGLPGRRERAGRGDVLVRLADRLDRQEGDRQLLRQELDGAGDHALGDAGVGEDREMRPVLLDRGNGEDRDPARGVALREVARRHLGPAASRKHGGVSVSGYRRGKRGGRIMAGGRPGPQAAGAGLRRRRRGPAAARGARRPRRREPARRCSCPAPRRNAPP